MADEPLPNQVPDIDLPDLKKKKKEKKKAGVAWGSGGTGAQAFEGATGGIGRGVASSAAAAAEGAAEAGADFAAEFGAEAAAEGASSEAGLFGRLLGRLINPLADWLGSTFAAQMVVGIGAAALVAGAVAAAAYMAGFLGRDAKGNIALNLGGIADNLHLGRGDASGLDFAKGAGRGSLKFEDGKAGEKAKPGEKAKDGEQAKNDDGKDKNGAPPEGDDNALGARPDADRLAHNLSGAKLSTGFGDGSSGAFAGINGGLKPGFSNSPNGFGKTANEHGTAAPLRRALRADHHGLNLGRRGLRDNRALGQLRSMAPLGSQMTQAGTAEEAGQSATTQFEGAAPIGGVAPTSPVDGGGTFTPPGPTGGGPGTVCTDADPNNCGYSDPCKTHYDPTQCKDVTGGVNGLDEMVKQAKSQIDMAKNILLALGIVVLVMEAIAFAWFCTCCAWVGAIFMAIAVAIAIAAVMIAHMMANMIHQQANAIRQAGMAIGNDGGKSPQAEMIADQVDKMGDEFGNVNMGILLGGISAFIGWNNINNDESALQKTADSIESQGNTPTDHRTPAQPSTGGDGTGTTTGDGTGTTTHPQ